MNTKVATSSPFCETDIVTEKRLGKPMTTRLALQQLWRKLIIKATSKLLIFYKSTLSSPIGYCPKTRHKKHDWPSSIRVLPLSPGYLQIRYSTCVSSISNKLKVAYCKNLNTRPQIDKNRFTIIFLTKIQHYIMCSEVVFSCFLEAAIPIYLTIINNTIKKQWLRTYAFLFITS